MASSKRYDTIVTRGRNSPSADPRWSNALMASLADASGLFEVFVGMAFDKTVVPGEPIPVSFWFWTWNNALDLGTGWSLKVYYTESSKSSGTMIFQLPAGPGESFLPYKFKWIPG
jgi:hypothetical protein